MVTTYWYRLVAKFPIIEIGASGVDLRVNPLTLQTTKAAMAKNLAFEEASIIVRPSIEYHDTGVKGQFQGAAHFQPSIGITANGYSDSSNSLALVVSGKLSVNTITCDGLRSPKTINTPRLRGDTFLFGAENFLVVLNEFSDTFWWDGTDSITVSKGMNLDIEENTHDTLDHSEIQQQLPHKAKLGHYIHGRNHISVDARDFFSPTAVTTDIHVSDIVTKRGAVVSDDILSMEEAVLDSAGGPLVAPSRIGTTVAFETLLNNGNNGEGELFDFRHNGVVSHNTLQNPRETTYNADDGVTVIKQGWDTRRITTVRLQTVSAVGRYAVYQLPDDIYFRSEFGFHFLKKTLGQGTIKDESLNHESHDIQPLFDIDEDADVSGAAVGLWIRGNRFMGTVGFECSERHSSSSMGRGIAVMNQATTFSEDDTPRIQWEGLWTPDSDVVGIHKFTEIGRRPMKRRFGFIGSCEDTNIVYGEFRPRHDGLDVRAGADLPIEWSYTTGAFAFNGIPQLDIVRSGIVDLIVDSTTSPIEIEVKTDQHDCWETWTTLEFDVDTKSLVSKSFGEPPDEVREASWFQFRIRGTGYIEIRTMDVEIAKSKEKDDGRDACVPVCSEQVNFFE